MKEEARTEAARAKAVAAAPKAANVRPRTNKAKATKEDVSQVVSGYGSDVVLAARRIKRIESKWSQLLLTTSTSTTPTSCRRSCNHPSADTCPERLRRLSAHPASYPYLSQLPSSFRAFFVVPTSTSISSFCRRLLLFLLLRQQQHSASVKYPGHHPSRLKKRRIERRRPSARKIRSRTSCNG